MRQKRYIFASVIIQITVEYILIKVHYFKSHECIMLKYSTC
jgi:hypothetical protein